ncbi:MAG: hypothetical protein U0M06_10990 [Clostridia bacterium]|nr:hypothetical protein [Clostridia bacterium]
MIKVFCRLYAKSNPAFPMLSIDTMREPNSGRLVSFNIEGLDRGDNTNTVEWGIYSNRGNLSFILPKTQENLFKDDVNFKEYSFSFFTYNDEEYKSCQIATFNVKDFKYNRESRLVEVELVDGLQDWQDIEVNINIPNMEYRATSSLLSIYETVYEQNLGLPIIVLSNEIKSLLAKIYVYYNHRVSTMSFWDFITEICSLSGTRIITDENGFPTLSLGTALTAVKVNSKDILSIEPTCAKRHNSISSVKIGIPRKINLEPVISSFAPKQLTFTDKGNNTYGFSYVCLIPSTKDKATMIKVLETKKNANITGNTASGKMPRNLLWKYGKAGAINGEQLTFHDNDNGFIDAISFGEYTNNDGENETYVSLLQGSINSYEYTLIAKDDVSWDVSFSPANIPTFEVYGNVIADGGDDSKTRTLNENGANTIELNSSPWIYIAKINEKDLYEWLFDKVSLLSDGRNCIEIECVLDNYYDNNGNLVKPKETPFSKYDVIIPYVSKKGEQKPYLGTDKNPMKFIVVGVNYSYNGHFVQKLYLQEYVED